MNRRIIKKIAIGSLLRNKFSFIPAALLFSQFVPYS